MHRLLVLVLALAVLLAPFDRGHAQTEGATMAAQYGGVPLVVRRGEGAAPVDRLLMLSPAPSDQQIARQNFALANVAVGTVQIANVATLAQDLMAPGTAFITQGSDLASPLLAGLFQPGTRFFTFSQSVGLTRVALRRPDGTQLSRGGADHMITSLNQNILISAGDPRAGLQTVLIPPGVTDFQAREVLAQIGLTPESIQVADTVSLSLLSSPGTALLNGETMFLDPNVDYVLSYAADMGVYLIGASVNLQEVTPASLIAPAPAPEPEAIPQPAPAPVSVPEPTPAPAPEPEPQPAPPPVAVEAVPDDPIQAADTSLTDGYLFVSGWAFDQAYVRPGFCDTGAVDIRVIQYVPTPSTRWEDFVGLARSTLNSTTYWDFDRCAGDRSLDVTMSLIFEGVEYARFTANITDADRIAGPNLEQIADVPEPTGFSQALSRVQRIDFRTVLPPEWTPGDPPGIASQQDARYAHAIYVEGLAAMDGIYEWTDESVELFELASQLGHPGATHQLLDRVQFNDVVSRIFYNLSQGNPPIGAEQRAMVRSHGVVFQRAVDQGIGNYVYLDRRLQDYNYDIADGLIELAEGAPPNHYELTTALNRAAADILNPVSAAYMALVGLPVEAGWQCDGEWCIAMAGLAQIRFVARSNGIDCVGSSPDAMRCSFQMVHVLRGHSALDGTAQQQLMDAIVLEPARAVPRQAAADLVRRADGWEIVSLIELQ